VHSVTDGLVTVHPSSSFGDSRWLLSDLPMTGHPLIVWRRAEGDNGRQVRPP
jgi:hypothetical protein